MSIYLKCIYFLAATLTVVIGFFVVILIVNKVKNKKVKVENIKQKKSSLYIKYNLKNREITINNYTYLNIDVSKNIVNVSRKEEFFDKVNNLQKNTNEKINYIEKTDNFIIDLTFSYRDTIDDCVVLRCDYSVEKIIKPVTLMNIEEMKKIHENSKEKTAAFYHLNIKDFNSINHRYGQNCGDYILETIKYRLSKIEKKHLYKGYIGSDKFVIYFNKKIKKKRAIKLIKNINKKISKPLDIGYINIDLIFGIGICVGKYDNLNEFINGAYVASDYAKKRKKYNMVIYNEGMNLEGNVIGICEEEISNVIDDKIVNIDYNPVFYYSKSKFVGYISNVVFGNKLIDFDKIKNVATQKNKIDQFMIAIIDNQLISYIKKRPNKSSKLFINLKLEDLATFLEVYLSNPSYSDCKIVICLDVRRGYEMINKFSNISSNISKIIQEGIEFALLINYNNMYDYDYIMKNASYLILDGTIVSNMNTTLSKNKVINLFELAKNYELDLFALDIKEYIEFENLIKYNVHYFSGPYFGKSAKKPNEIEQSKTRIFAKFMKDSKKK